MSARYLGGAPRAAVALQALAAVACAVAFTAAVADDARGRRETLRVDGVDITYVRSRLEGRARQQVQAQADAWMREHPIEPVVRSRSAEWEIVGQRRGGEFRTAQFKDDAAGVLAAYSWRALAARPRPAALPLRMPRAVRIVRTFETVREQPAVLDVVAEAAIMPAELGRLLEHAARREGWTIDPGAADIASARGTHTLVWRRDAAELMAVIGPSTGGATLLLHAVVRAPLAGAGP